MQSDDPMKRLARLINGPVKKKNVLTAMDKEDVEKWNQLKAVTDEVRTLHNKMESLRKNFWSGLEIKYGAFDKNLSVDIDTGTIQYETEEDEENDGD